MHKYKLEKQQQYNNFTVVAGLAYESTTRFQLSFEGQVSSFYKKNCLWQKDFASIYEHVAIFITQNQKQKKKKVMPKSWNISINFWLLLLFLLLWYILMTFVFFFLQKCGVNSKIFNSFFFLGFYYLKLDKRHFSNWYSSATNSMFQSILYKVKVLFFLLSRLRKCKKFKRQNNNINCRQ